VSIEETGMGNIIRVETPLTHEVAETLKTGDRVLISGVLYSARDAAHKRMVESIRRGAALPFDLSGQIIYYVGPTPPKPGASIGSAGPTTSSRMDPYAPTLIEKGLKGMIGKGARGDAVIEAMIRYRVVYFAATGGAGALISGTIKRAEVVAYEDLGTEAVRRLHAEDFPAVVACDVRGNDLYREGKMKYRRVQT
jgi:fumarate hydratase subunit beta